MKFIKKIQNRSGQSAIEFIMIVVVVFFFLLFFLSFSIALIITDYVEYATFMAARTYKSGFGSPEVQQRHARTVFNQYFEKIKGIARNESLNFVATDPENPQTEGMEVSYEIDLFYLPPVFVKDTIPSSIRLSTETYLGRDPSHSECVNFFDGFSRRLGLGVEGGLLSQMEDNGC